MPTASLELLLQTVLKEDEDIFKIQYHKHKLVFAFLHMRLLYMCRQICGLIFKESKQI